MSFVKRCGCGATYDEAHWRELRIVGRVEPEEVRQIARGWPDGTFVEARLCRHCTAIITRKGV